MDDREQPDKVTSIDAEECIDPSISQSIVKLSQSEVDRMVQEAEKYRDEDVANESKYEAESGLERFRGHSCGPHVSCVDEHMDCSCDCISNFQKW